jgi:hypothetical protein
VVSEIFSWCKPGRGALVRLGREKRGEVEPEDLSGNRHDRIGGQPAGRRASHPLKAGRFDSALTNPTQKGPTVFGNFKIYLATGLIPRRSRTCFGTVTWPLLVTVTVIVASSVMPNRLLVLLNLGRTLSLVSCEYLSCCVATCQFVRAERMKPQRPRCCSRVEPNLLPPRRFITVAMTARDDGIVNSSLTLQRSARFAQSAEMPTDAPPWTLTLNASASRTDPARKLLFAQNPRRCGLQL